MSPQPFAQPLHGKRFLVTRPEGQADQLLAGIRALGGDVTHIPFLAIEPAIDQAALKQIADHLPQYRACIFISANAVQCAWSGLAPQGWPRTLAAATVGPGTARVLLARGVSHIIVPARRFDSEGLLAEPDFAENQCHGQAFALIRGEGGRDFLAQTLRERGAQVDEAAVYRRRLHPAALSRLAEWLAAGAPAASTLLVSSSESLQRVLEQAAPLLVEQLRSATLLVPHPKIADSAQRLGCKRVFTSAGGDAGLLEALRSYNTMSKIPMTNETETP